jgi:hypothetical protein
MVWLSPTNRADLPLEGKGTSFFFATGLAGGVIFFAPNKLVHNPNIQIILINLFI